MSRYSNNAAERRQKPMWRGVKTFWFHDTADGATASAIVLSLIETAKANNLNIYHYLYTLLLYMPDYKNEPAGIKQLLPWSDFIKERCTGIIDIEKVKTWRTWEPEYLKFPGSRDRVIIHRLRLEIVSCYQYLS